jgi:integrase
MRYWEGGWRQPKRIVMPLSVEVARFWSSFRTSRDLAIVGLMLLQGLRLREVIALNCEDVLLAEAHPRISENLPRISETPARCGSGGLAAQCDAFLRSH